MDLLEPRYLEPEWYEVGDVRYVAMPPVLMCPRCGMVQSMVWESERQEFRFTPYHGSPCVEYDSEGGYHGT